LQLAVKAGLEISRHKASLRVPEALLSEDIARCGGYEGAAVRHGTPEEENEDLNGKMLWSLPRGLFEPDAPCVAHWQAPRKKCGGQFRRNALSQHTISAENVA